MLLIFYQIGVLFRYYYFRYCFFLIFLLIFLSQFTNVNSTPISNTEIINWTYTEINAFTLNTSLSEDLFNFKSYLDTPFTQISTLSPNKTFYAKICFPTNHDRDVISPPLQIFAISYIARLNLTSLTTITCTLIMFYNRQYIYFNESCSFVHPQIRPNANFSISRNNDWERLNSQLKSINISPLDSYIVTLLLNADPIKISVCFAGRKFTLPLLSLQANKSFLSQEIYIINHSLESSNMICSIIWVLAEKRNWQSVCAPFDKNYKCCSDSNGELHCVHFTLCLSV